MTVESSDQGTIQPQLGLICARYHGRRNELIPILQDVQKVLGYVPREAMREIARFLNLPESTVYGVVTFYAQFYLTRQGKHRIKVCRGTACHVRGSARIMEVVKKKLGIKPGETTPDYRFSLERVACFGSCALAPVMVVDGKVHGRMTPQKAEKILDQMR
jgi:NADH-quinone oxidoreductase subunit E